MRSRSVSEKDWTVSLTTVEGRERFELAIGNYQLGMLKGTNPKSATLVKRKDGSYYIQICLESEPPEPQDSDEVLGVDLGRTLHIHRKGNCGWHGDADFNGAKNIQSIGLLVNQPGGPWLSCEITGGLLKARAVRDSVSVG